MSLTLEEVKHIADLARLDLSAEELQRYCQQLSAILDYAAILQTIDTREIPPTSSVLVARSVFRADEPRPGLTRDDLMSNAPHTQQNQFRVPPVME
jgi:aspartyl-tRNA(Asn)/glutamyl-tRNA(Gln) amidotransferase subunit C